MIKSIGSYLFTLVFFDICCYKSEATFSDGIQNVTVALGETVTLSCPLEFPGGVVQPYSVHWLRRGKPNPIYLWHEGQKPIVSAEYEGRVALVTPASLSIDAVLPSDPGWYECRIFIQQSGSLETLRNDTWVLLQISDDLYFIEEPKAVTVIPGEEVTLPCTFSVPTQLQWKFNGQYIDLRKHSHLVSRNGDLHVQPQNNFSTISEVDGVYQCVAFIGEVALSSQPSRLSVAVLQPYQEQDNITEKGDEGGIVIIPCYPPLSIPEGVVHLQKDGVPIELSERVYRLQTGAFKITSLQKTDAGSYRCVLANRLLNISVTASWTVNVEIIKPESKYAPQLVVQPKKSYTAAQNGNLTLECAAAGYPLPTVSWSKYGGQLPEHRHSIQQGNLHLFNIQNGDEGTYLCEADNGFDKRATAISFVEIQDYPSIIRPLQAQNQTVKEGSLVTFQCSTNGVTKPTLEWVHNGKNLTSSDKIVIKDSRLILKDVTLSSGGFYQCFVRNDLGTLYSTAHLIVLPNIVSISADARKDPIKPGMDDTGEVNVRNEENSEEATEDYWGTTSKYDKSNNREKGRNSHKDKMVPPSRPEITKLSDESVMVRWTVPENDGLKISFFKVQYKDVSKSNSRWMTIDDEIASHIHSFEVSNLKLGHVYKFRIAAVYSNNDNKLGNNSFKFHLQKEPPMRKPIIGPTIIYTEAISPTAILIQWEHTDSEMVPIEGFFIYYRETTSAGLYLQVPVIGANTQSHIISHLLPKVTYEIKMQCFNIAGTSEFSNIVTQSTQDYLTTRTESDFHLSTPIPDSSPSNELVYKVLSIVLGIVLCLVMPFLLFGAFKCYQKYQHPTTKRRQYEGSFQQSEFELQGLTETKLKNGNPTTNGYMMPNGYSLGKPLHATISPEAHLQDKQNSLTEIDKTNHSCESAEEYNENSWNDPNITSQTAIDTTLEENKYTPQPMSDLPLSNPEVIRFSSFRKPVPEEDDANTKSALLQNKED